VLEFVLLFTDLCEAALFLVWLFLIGLQSCTAVLIFT